MSNVYHRPIDANAADVEQIPCYFSDHCRLKDVQEWLDEQPTIDVIPMDVHRKCMEDENKKRVLAEKTNRRILENYVPVCHGRWIWDEVSFNYTCSSCKCSFDYSTMYGLFDHGFAYASYCPNCGAKMDGENAHEV